MKTALIVLFVLNQIKGPSAEEQAATAYQDAHLLFRAKQYQDALILTQKCLELDPKKVECHLVAGSAYASLKEQEKAAQHYRDFLRLAPDHKAAPRVSKMLEDFDNHKKAPLAPGQDEAARGVYEDALKLFRAKQYTEAIHMVERCLVLDPAMADCHKLAGAVYASTRQMEKAAEHYREFLKLAPDNRDASKVRQMLEQYERQKPQ